MDFIEAGLTVKKGDLNYIKECLLNICQENFFYFPFISLSCISFHRSSVLKPKTNCRLFNMMIVWGLKLPELLPDKQAMIG